MMAITIWQPWASLILHGAKPYEFRGWIPPRSIIGQRIAIHAGARPIRRAEVQDLIARIHSGSTAWTTALLIEPAAAVLERALLSPGSLPLSAVICTATLGEPRRADIISREFGRNDSSRSEHFNWGWPLTDIAPVMPPVECRGAQGFWDWQP